MFSNVKKFISDNTGLLIRIDDVNENMDWQLMQKIEKLFDEHSIKPVLGVIPNNKDQSFSTFEKNENFWSRVRDWKKKNWEIEMHGNSHVYDTSCEGKKDYFNHGGGSEFYGHSLETQINRIEKGLEKFKKENIEIKSFFAPNHTYDENTFIALKKCGIFQVLDGYGLMPYQEKDIYFIPQLFNKILILPFGIQSTQIHLHDWQNNDFQNFKDFIKKNVNKIISFQTAIKKTNNSTIYRMAKTFIKSILKLKRLNLKKNSEFKHLNKG